jgi:hypothetical protein
MAHIDTQVIGLTVQLLGILLIAISILIKKPRKIFQELVGLVPIGRVRAMRHTVYKKNQLLLGIVFLLVGYSVQIYGLADGRVSSAPVGPIIEPTVTRADFLIVFVSVVGAVLALSIVMNIMVFLWTRVSFRRQLSEYLRDTEFSFEQNIQLTKEIGELVGVPRKNDSSIEEYVSELKSSLKLVEMR